MKHVGNFLVGTLSCMGVSLALPDTVSNASALSPTVLQSLEALISMVTGLLSAILVAWLKQKWTKNVQK
jgi:hypothetical protein